MDLLVKLYSLPPAPVDRGSYKKIGRGDYTETWIRRAFAAEKYLVTAFVAENFSRGWASECEIAFARQPLACFVAVSVDTICGFACYDATARGFFGPIGVKEQQRGRGVGSALLLATLNDMRAKGYGYAIIGATDNLEFYRVVGATEIADSAPGFYSEMLHERVRP
jgi:ribosomal protein S18 acetylase RimI-like enzyme